MSRSFRHTPIFGNTGAPSEQQDKRKANRRWRRAAKETVRGELQKTWTAVEIKSVEPWWDPWRFSPIYEEERVLDISHLENLILPAMRELSNVYTFEKDGKLYWLDAEPKYMRK